MGRALRPVNARVSRVAMRDGPFARGGLGGSGAHRNPVRFASDGRNLAYNWA